MTAVGQSLGHGDLASEILSAANIQPETGLATDYLNHFNEVVMLIDMIAEMPECVDDVLSWKPTCYEDHFQHTGFPAKELAVKAYQAAPSDIKSHFVSLIGQLNTQIETVQSILDSDDVDRFDRAQMNVTKEIQPLLQAASGAIHGQMNVGFNEDPSDTQDSIDALFD